MTTLFAHRLNRDESFDSICTTCFKTIASEDSEGKLLTHEERHSCDPGWQFTRARWQNLSAQASERRTVQPYKRRRAA
jgi:hypothetical protein